MSTLDELLAVVRSQVGELSPDEYAIFEGMVAATDSLGGGLEPTLFDARSAGEVFYAFRFRPCPFCGRPLVDHSLDLERVGVVVRCRADRSVRPVPQWLTGPAKPPGWQAPLAIALWVGIPLITLGFLGWLMPLISAVMFRTGRWVLGAVLWLLLTGAAVAAAVQVPEDINADLGVWDGLLVLFWIAAIGWGALQVRPWLRGIRAEPSRPASTGYYG